MQMSYQTSPVSAAVSRLILRALSPSTPRQNQGLTLIECLVAIVVIAAVIGIITPAFVVAVATRVQSQRGEQALELAQGEIDQIRLLVERGNYTADQLPQAAAAADIVAGTTYGEFQPANIIGPTAGTTNLIEPKDIDPAKPYQALTLDKTRAIDIDGDGKYDFAMQVYRTTGVSVDSLPVAFSMGVRVYDLDAIEQNTGTLSIEPARLGLSGGTGQRGTRPMATLYTTIARTEQKNSLCQYVDLANQKLDPADKVTPPLGCN